MQLEEFRVGSEVLNSLYYVPDFISVEEEESLLSNLRASRQQWKQVSGRRLQNLGGVVHKQGLIPAPLPSWLQLLLSRITAQTGIYGEGQLPNHVLVNAYMPGEGILAHEDGPCYHPAVAILSLGAPAVMRFARKRSETEAARGHESEPTKSHQLVASVACMPRSLLVFRDDAYTSCLHGIMEAEVEFIDPSVVNVQQAGLQPGQQLQRDGERISLTVRKVNKVHKLGIRQGASIQPGWPR